jgi:hypothetical protein
MHPDIYGETEAWFMLHLVYGLRRDGIQSEYNVENCQRGLNSFLEPLPEGTRAYLDAIRAAALALYGRVLDAKGMSLIVDKTPRYYHILDELKDLFPAARFILLIRNPLAVLASMLSARESRPGRGWTELGRPDRVHDLLTAPRQIDSFITKVGDEAIVVRYEDLVTRAEGTIRSLCTKLNVSFFPQMLQYGAPDHRSVIGDRGRIRAHDKPVTDYVDVWKSAFSTPLRAHLAHSYLEQLGDPLLDRLGYSRRELLASLPTRPSAIRYRRVWSLISTPEEELPWWRRIKLQALRSLHRRGWWRTALRAGHFAAGGRAISRREVVGRSDSLSI